MHSSNNHPTYTITLDAFQLDRDDCDDLIDTDARYVLVDQRFWSNYICPLIDSNDELVYAIRALYSGPHAVTVN